MIVNHENIGKTTPQTRSCSERANFLAKHFPQPQGRQPGGSVLPMRNLAGTKPAGLYSLFTLGFNLPIPCNRSIHRVNDPFRKGEIS